LKHSWTTSRALLRHRLRKINSYIMLSSISISFITQQSMKYY